MEYDIEGDIKTELVDYDSHIDGNLQKNTIDPLMDKKDIQETMKNIKTEYDDDGFPQYNEITIVCKTESRIKSEDFDNIKNENFCEISIEKEKESLDAKKGLKI